MQISIQWLHPPGLISLWSQPLGLVVALSRNHVLWQALLVNSNPVPRQLQMIGPPFTCAKALYGCGSGPNSVCCSLSAAAEVRRQASASSSVSVDVFGLLHSAWLLHSALRPWT